MAAGYVALPAAQFPKNAMLDFSGLNSGLDAMHQSGIDKDNAMLRQKADARADSELAMQKTNFGNQQTTFQQGQEDRRVQALGRLAELADQEQDPVRKQQYWDRAGKIHPGWANLGPEYHSVNTGPKLALAEAGKLQDPLDQQIKANQANPTKFETVGHDAFGNASYGFVNPQKQTITPGQQTAMGDASQQTTGVNGDAFLKTLPQPIADQVKALAEGRMQFPTGFAMSKPYWQKMVSAVSKYDPSFDAINYNSRTKTRNDFTSGKSAQNVTSFNTAIQHIDELDKSVDPLGNTSVPLFNSVRNAVRGQGSQEYQTAQKVFETSKNAVVDELTRAFRGSGGNVHDIESWERTIHGADSPAALHSAVKQGLVLLKGRIEAVGDQYNRGMSTTKDPVELLSPKAQDAVKRILADPGGQAAGATPKIQGALPAEAAPTAVNAQGHKIMWDGSQWVDAQ